MEKLNFISQAIKKAKEDLKRYESIVIIARLSDDYDDNIYKPFLKIYSTELLLDEKDVEKLGINLDMYGFFDNRRSKDDYQIFVLNHENYVDIINDDDIASLYLLNDEEYQQIVHYTGKENYDIPIFQPQL